VLGQVVIAVGLLLASTATSYAVLVLLLIFAASATGC
jgi:hypothetical protein